MELILHSCPVCHKSYLCDHKCKHKKKRTYNKKKSKQILIPISELKQNKQSHRIETPIQTCEKCGEKYLYFHKCKPSKDYLKIADKKIIKKYKELGTLKKTAKYFNAPISYISNIIKLHKSKTKKITKSKEPIKTIDIKKQLIQQNTNKQSDTETFSQNDQLFIIPQAIIAGYGRVPTIQYKCLNCEALFFPGKDEYNPFCDICSKLEIDSTDFQKDNHFYINIIDYIQKIPASFKNRTQSNFKKVYKRDNYTCQYCYYSPRYCFNQISLNVDHIIPWSHGGSNAMTNLKLSCQWCNSHLSNLVFNSFIDKKIYIVNQRQKEKLPYTEKQWRQISGIYIGEIVY